MVILSTNITDNLTTDIGCNLYFRKLVYSRFVREFVISLLIGIRYFFPQVQRTGQRSVEYLRKILHESGF